MNKCWTNIVFYVVQFSTYSLCDFSSSLPPDAVDCNEYAFSRLHWVKDSTLHSSMTRPTHCQSHAILSLKCILDPTLYLIHNLGYTWNNCADSTLWISYIQRALQWCLFIFRSCRIFTTVTLNSLKFPKLKNTKKSFKKGLLCNHFTHNIF